jgi:putative MATE family efflux protein
MKTASNYLQTLWQREDIRAFISRSWTVSWPMTVIMLFEFLISLTDVYIAGKINKEVQAAYGFVMQIYFIFTVIGNAITIGTVAVVSRLCQAIDDDDFSIAIFSSMTATLVAGLVLGLAGIFLSPIIFDLLKIPEVLRQYTHSLAKIFAAGLIFHYLLINSNGILRSCKGIKKSLRTMAIVCITNIGLNFFLVFHTSIGYRGIALSTAISVVIGSLWNLWLIKTPLFKLIKMSVEFIKKIAAIGWPAGLLQVIWQLASMVLYLILSALPENNIEVIAAFTNGLRIEAAVFLPAFAFNMSNAVVVGNFLGVKRQHDAFRGGLVTTGIGVGIVVLLATAVILNVRSISTILSNNPLVINETVRYLYICMICEPIMAWGVILSGGLNGAGDTKGVMMIVALSVWLVRIPLSYLFGVIFAFGAVAIWWSMNASLVVQAIFISRRYFSKKWLGV